VGKNSILVISSLELPMRSIACCGVAASPERNLLSASSSVHMLREHLGSRIAGRVFQSRVGTPLENRDICRRVLKPICRKLGIQPGGMHAFRHGRVSQLQANGVPADFTKSQVGHSSLRTTSGYTHFTDAFKRETVERLAPKLPQ
jgi:integrase